MSSAEAEYAVKVRNIPSEDSKTFILTVERDILLERVNIQHMLLSILALKLRNPVKEILESTDHCLRRGVKLLIPVKIRFHKPHAHTRFQSSLEEELLQARTDGVGDAIVVPPVLASQFELKIGLLNLVTSISFHGFENGDPHSHQDSLNSAAGGNLLTRNTQEALTIIENKSKVRTSRNKLHVLSASSSSSQDAAIISLTKTLGVVIDVFGSFIPKGMDWEKSDTVEDLSLKGGIDLRRWKS
ncbi:hypothetical protein Tco_0481277 [Tanacetum coccineum]